MKLFFENEFLTYNNMTIEQKDFTYKGWTFNFLPRTTFVGLILF